MAVHVAHVHRLGNRHGGEVKSGRPVTTVLGIAILAMLALTVLPAQQRETAVTRATTGALSAFDYIAIQQLVRRSAWAVDSGDNYGYAYADLFTPDGVFVDTTNGSDGRTYQGRDQLAAVARGGARGATVQSHITMNHVIKPSPDGAAGRAYVVIVDVGVVGKPNRVNRGGYYEDEYQNTGLGWRFKRRTYHASKVDVWPASAPGPVK
jgi:hypothetical protein